MEHQNRDSVPGTGFTVEDIQIIDRDGAVIRSTIFASNGACRVCLFRARALRPKLGD
jgi:hypothetical protein